MFNEAGACAPAFFVPLRQIEHYSRIMEQKKKYAIHFITYLCGQIQADYIKAFDDPDTARSYIDSLTFDIVTMRGGVVRYGLVSPCLGRPSYYARIE